jgi:hypothetical protein
MTVTAGAAVFVAVTVAEGTRSVGMSSDGQQADTAIPGVWVCRPEVESRHGTLEAWTGERRTGGGEGNT